MNQLHTYPLSDDDESIAMTTTPNLSLPYLESGQAQKHVTHNEALRLLDALVMLSVRDRDLSAPPPAPEEGARYLVQAPGSGAFAGKGNAIAHYADGGWLFHTPRAGWLCFVADEAILLVFDGEAWMNAGTQSGVGSALQNLTRLGVGTEADAVNPFAAKLNNALWAARTEAEGGDGDLRYKMNKEAAGNTLSLLMQTGWSGRAEIGLTGDDDFHFKVSADGGTWRDAIVIDRDSGAVSFPHTSIAGGRETLAADRTYYVRTDGSDSNDGLANTAGGAFLTIQKAINTVAAIDLSVHHVTIQVADGTYTAPVVLNGSWIGSGTVTLAGNVATPANVLLSTTGATCIAAANRAALTVKGMTLQTAAAGSCIQAATGAAIELAQGIVFGACAWHHMMATLNGTIRIAAAYQIAGGGLTHITANLGGVVSGINLAGIALTGTPAFNASFAFIFASSGGVVEYYGNTFSGSATGPRFLTNLCGVVNVNGATPNTYLPGNLTGSTASGGQCA